MASCDINYARQADVLYAGYLGGMNNLLHARKK
jgi:hypothetical protein